MRVFRLTFLLVITSALLLCSFKQKNGKVINISVDRIQIILGPENEIIFTPVDISCDDSEFLTDSTLVNDKKSIAEIINCINSAQFLPNQKPNDTRGKIFLFYKTKLVDSLCISHTGLFVIGGSKFYRSDNPNLYDLCDHFRLNKRSAGNK